MNSGMLTHADLKTMVKELRRHEGIDIQWDKKAGTIIVKDMGFTCLRGIQKDRNTWIISYSETPNVHWNFITG